MPSKIRPHRVFVGKKGKLHIKLNSKKTSINSSNAKVKNVINIMIKHGPRSRRTQPKKQVEQAMVSPPLAPVYINKLGDPMKDPIYNPQKSLTTDNERFINLIEKLTQKKIATVDVSTQANGAEPIAIAVPDIDVGGEQAAKLADEAAVEEGVAQEAEDVLDVPGDGAAEQKDEADDDIQAREQLSALHSYTSVEPRRR